MVTIRKGDHTLRVTRGAFKSMYKPMGYVLEEDWEDAGVLPASDGDAHTPGTQREPEDDPKDDPEEESEEEDTENDDDDEDENLEEKPLSEMNFKELKAAAAARDIDTSGMTSKKELRDAIREYEEED